MYSFILMIHSLVRWIVVVFALIALFKALQGWLKDKEWSSEDKRNGLIFTISLDIQMLTGILLYFFLSPIMKTVWSDFGAAMQNETLRFFAVEHLPWMILGTAFAHIGYRAGKSDLDGNQKHRAASLWYGASIVVILIGMPWFRPFLPF